MESSHGRWVANLSGRFGVQILNFKILYSKAGVNIIQLDVLQELERAPFESLRLVYRLVEDTRRLPCEKSHFNESR